MTESCRHPGHAPHPPPSPTAWALAATIIGAVVGAVGLLRVGIEARDALRDADREALIRLERIEARLGADIRALDAELEARIAADRAFIRQTCNDVSRLYVLANIPPPNDCGRP